MPINRMTSAFMGFPPRKMQNEMVDPAGEDGCCWFDRPSFQGECGTHQLRVDAWRAGRNGTDNHQRTLSIRARKSQAIRILLYNGNGRLLRRNGSFGYKNYSDKIK